MEQIFNPTRKILIGVIHLDPLPGSPRWAGSMAALLRHAVADAQAYQRGGADALVLENFGDVPFLPGGVGPETVASLAVAGWTVRQTVDLPLGFNVLRNDPRSALALCVACQGAFIRVNVHTGVAIADQGLLQGDAAATLRYRRSLGIEARIFADVHVKHAVPLGHQPLADSAQDTWQRGLADALIITGSATGKPARLDDVKTARAACPGARLLLGSGVTPANALPFLPFVDGLIVGTALKGSHGRVQASRVSRLARVLARHRS